MICPSCGAEVEEGADLCLECGEPMGDSPAARVARSEGTDAAAPTGTPRMSSASPPRTSSASPPRTSSASPPPATPPRAAPARKWAHVEEPEPRRCPGCGLKSLAARCPSCGTRLRSDEE